MDSCADDGKKNDTEQASSLPEEKLNVAILCMSLVCKAMIGLGTLASFWATVVLLGGFATLIKEQDFWYVTVIAFIQQSMGIFGGYEDAAHQIYMRAPPAVMKIKWTINWERQASWWRRRANPQPRHQPGRGRGTTKRVTRSKSEWRKRQEEGFSPYLTRNFLGFVMRSALWVAQLTAVSTCMVLSMMRLKKQDYVDQEYLGHDDHRNIKRSLNIFYGLVFAQGIIFIWLLLNPLFYWFSIWTRYQYMLVGPSCSNVLSRYKNENYLQFITGTGNVRTTLNIDLITFAKNLVVSGSIDDQSEGIRAMDGILRSHEYSSLALVRLRASLNDDELGKLVGMLGITGTTDDEGMRGHAARVVLKLTPGILVSSCPQIICAISSLLNTCHNKMSNMDVDLVWFGLRILDKLTDNPDNCKHVMDDGGDLLSKIIYLTNRCGYGSTSSTISDSWIEQEIIPLLQKEDDIPPPLAQKIDQEIIVGMSLKILSKLVVAPGDAGVNFRRETTNNFHFMINTRMILELVEATRVISCLAVDAAVKKEIGMLPEVIKKLKDSLFSRAPYVNITKVAAKLLLLEYTTSEQLKQIKSFIEENHKLDDQSFSVPVSAFIEELDPKQLLIPWTKRVLQNLDLEDLVSAPRVNHSQAAAEALMLLTTGCEDNVVAFLQEINQEELNKIVMMLFDEDGEKENRKKLAHLQGRNLQPETLCTLQKIFCAGDEKYTRSMLAKLLQNLRAYSRPNKFDKYMPIIDDTLSKVFKGIVEEVASLEDTSSTNEKLAHVKDDLWIKQGKILESFIGLAVQICRSQNPDEFAKALDDANLRLDTFVQKLKKILELFKYPTTDFPSIRRSTLELMTCMVEKNSSYREVLLQCGVYEQLHEVAKTARKLESFKLFHCGVHVLGEHDKDPRDLGISSISSLATELQEQGS